MKKEIFLFLTQSERIEFLKTQTPAAYRMSSGKYITLYRFDDFWAETVEGDEQGLNIFPNGTPEENDFNQIFFKRGGLDVSKLISKDDPYSYFRESSNIIISFIRKRIPKLPPIYFDFIDSPSLNAGATKFKAKYYIGINSGVHFLLIDMFNKIFASKNNLPLLGNITEESSENFELNRIFNEGPALDTSKTDFITPKDPDRNIYAIQYFHFAMDFMILHEIAHITFGHVDYVQNQISLLLWTELEYEPSQSNGVMPSRAQLMELQADTFATINFLMLAENLVSKNTTMQKIQNMIFQNIETFLEHWIFAIYCQFRIVNFKRLDTSEAKLLSHPPPTVRILKIITTIQVYLSQSKVPNYEKILSNMYKIIELAEISFSSITHNQNQYDIFISNYKITNDYLNDINKEGQNLKTQLEPFTFLKD